MIAFFALTFSRHWLLGSIGSSHSLADAIGLNCEIWKARKDKVSRSQLVAGARRAQVHGVD